MNASHSTTTSNQLPAADLAEVMDIALDAEKALRDWLKKNKAPKAIRQIADRLMPLHSYEAMARETGKVSPIMNLMIDSTLLETACAVERYNTQAARA